MEKEAAYDKWRKDSSFIGTGFLKIKKGNLSPEHRLGKPIYYEKMNKGYFDPCGWSAFRQFGICQLNIDSCWLLWLTLHLQKEDLKFKTS